MPRRRLGPYNESMCSFCGSALPADRKPGFNEACESCGRDLHACVNCRFYSPGIHWDCAETSITEGISDKEKRNPCDWFETAPRLKAAGKGDPSAQRAGEKARRDLDKLFGG